MKFLKIFVLSLVFISCQNKLIGTWTMCSMDGKYYEYKITKNYIIVLMEKLERPLVFKIEKLKKNGVLISEFKDGDEYIFNNDKLTLIAEDKNRITVKSSRFDEQYQMFKADFLIKEIDSTNLNTWYKETIIQYKKRAKLKKCQDIRSEKEKQIDTIDIKMLDESDVPTDFDIKNKK